ncbi:MAG: HAMP domain-containing sensor histidine kinase, partial [Gemmatimonadota bacterium]
AATEWIVRGRDGSTVIAGTDSPSGPLALNATIAGNFPPWFIEFYQRPQSSYRLLIASGQSIYLYMFLAIATILGFGLVLTTRAVTHELELARLKSDFVSTVSHEFKSPLTSIRQLAEMLQTGRVPTEERRQRYYDILVEQSSRLSSLVTNVLDLARIEEGRREFRFEPVDLGAVVRELVETTQNRVGHEGFEVRAHVQEPLPPVRGDAEALRQALSNLLNNAIQYSGEARQINVTASAEGGVVTVAVEDFGLGIPDEEVGKVFDRFYRGSDELTRSTRGSGLGLTLVKETVEAHDGSVEVKSHVGRGSTFCIKLPAMTEPNHG